jgi:uncharacterized protein YceH (UPF0502 family)
MRETRWMQLLTGPAPAPFPETDSTASNHALDPPGLAAIAAELDALRDEVAALKAAVAALQGGKQGT